jgi:hypothetical protein
LALAAFLVGLGAVGAGCGGRPPAVPAAVPAAAPAPLEPAAAEAFLDELEERTFRYFWDLADPGTGLVPDRWPTESFASIAATGFGLTAYPIGVERGWVSRAEARDRVLTALRFFWGAPQGPEAAGIAGHRGFFYHFLDAAGGRRFETVELSTIDTTLLLGGMLFCRGYFDGPEPEEAEIRDLATRIYQRVEWTWAQPHPPAVSLGWRPEKGFVDYDWRGYNEAMLLYLLALGSPTHPIADGAWEEWTGGYRWESFAGYDHLVFPPLFGHQYSHVWVDFRGIADAFMRERGIDYAENSRRATLAQRAWAADNPRRWRGLDAEVWGVSACDGPADVTVKVTLADGDRERRRFWTYAGRGVGPGRGTDDGTIAPTAAGGSIAFTPEESLAALAAMRSRYGEHQWGK